MSTEHTPKPWHINGNYVEGVTRYSRAAGNDVAINRFWAQVYMGHDCTEKEAQANIQLIASAPELLEALQGLLAVVNVRIDDPRIDAFDKARAAITKATRLP